MRVPLPAAFDRFDAVVDQAWEHLRGNQLVDRMFYLASDVGDFGLLWLSIGAAQAAFGPARKIPAAIRLAGALAAESVIVNGGIKSLFRRERPEAAEGRPMHLRQPKTSAFPSGHATSAVTAVLLFTEVATPWAPLYWALAGIVAASRVHVRIHHASDVIGGLAVGTVLGHMARRIAPLG